MKTHIHFSMMRICLLLMFFLAFFSYPRQGYSTFYNISDVVDVMRQNGLDVQKYQDTYHFDFIEENPQGTIRESGVDFIGSAKGNDFRPLIDNLIDGNIPLNSPEIIQRLGKAFLKNSLEINSAEELSQALLDTYYGGDPEKKDWKSWSAAKNGVVGANAFKHHQVNEILLDNLLIAVEKEIEDKNKPVLPDTPVSEPTGDTCGDPDNPFNSVLCSGAKLFGYIRTLAALASAFALVAFSVNAIFGNVNWKWFMGVVFGLIVISLTGALVDFIVEAPDAQIRGEYVNDTLW